MKAFHGSRACVSYDARARPTDESDESLPETDLDDGLITDGGFDKALVLRGDGLAAREAKKKGDQALHRQSIHVPIAGMSWRALNMVHRLCQQYLHSMHKLTIGNGVDPGTYLYEESEALQCGQPSWPSCPRPPLAVHSSSS